MARVLRALAVAAVLCTASAWSGAAEAASRTFHLTVGDAFESVGDTNAFLVSLGRDARRLKLVPGGTRFAGQTCAELGTRFGLTAVTVLEDPTALATLVQTGRGKDASALQGAFARAGITSWTPPAADAESDLPLWGASAVSRGLRFAAAGFDVGTTSGLAGPAERARILRFRVNVPAVPKTDGTYRFLLELIGRAPDPDAGAGAFVDRRCFTFVDLAPLDLEALVQLVDTTVESFTARSVLLDRLDTIAYRLGQRDTQGALDALAVFTSHLVARSPDLIPLATARRLVEAAFHFRRGLLFTPTFAVCGNGTRETGEACDGADLGGFGCTNLGFGAGTLACSSECRFVTTDCTAAGACGNGIIESGEECDDGAQNSDTEPDACRTTCRQAFCGDGVIDLFEDCEDRDLFGETCRTLGYSGGTLRCDDECYYDEDRCND